MIITAVPAFNFFFVWDDDLSALYESIMRCASASISESRAELGTSLLKTKYAESKYFELVSFTRMILR